MKKLGLSFLALAGILLTSCEEKIPGDNPIVPGGWFVYMNQRLEDEEGQSITITSGEIVDGYVKLDGEFSLQGRFADFDECFLSYLNPSTKAHPAGSLPFDKEKTIEFNNISLPQDSYSGHLSLFYDISYFDLCDDSGWSFESEIYLKTYNNANFICASVEFTAEQVQEIIQNTPETICCGVCMSE